MSITPIREALARLAAQRLVVWEENRGFTVAPLLSKQKYHNLYEAREFLELACVRSAVVTPGELDRLAEILERTTSAGRGPSYSEYVEFGRLDEEFHLALVRMSSNGFLAQAFESLNFHLHQTRIYAGQGVSDFSDACNEHARILDAFHGGSLADVVRVDKAHLRRARRRGWEILRSGAQ
jgi:DNA-binding GntR family transcriptional regulator